MSPAREDSPPETKPKRRRVAVKGEHSEAPPAARAVPGGPAGAGDAALAPAPAVAPAAVAPAADGFRPGHIIHVKVWNFTTYTYGEFNLSPTLNMIIGPNGTGKSTLVSAICLGLGGKIDLIKRKLLRSMIRLGASEARINITLRTGSSSQQSHDLSRDCTISRSFSESESKWKIDGRRADERSVRSLCQLLNIQLDNLCHFLPQERVAEFAGLSPERLLLETERTVGHGELHAMHEDLVRSDNERQQLRAKVEATEQRHAALAAERDQLQQEAAKYEEYEAKTRELQNHVKLIPYAQIQDLKVQQRELKRERDRAKRALDTFDATARVPIERQLTQWRRHAEERAAELERQRQARQSANAEWSEVARALAAERDRIAEWRHAIAQLRARSGKKLQELDALTREQAELARRLAELDDDGDVEALKRSRDATHTELGDMRARLEELEFAVRPQRQQFEALGVQLEEKRERLLSRDKLAVLHNAAAGRRNELVENSLGAHRLLRTHPQLRLRYFEAPVVSCEVDKRYAKHIEKVIDNNTLLGILFCDRAAYEEVSAVVSARYNVPMRVATRPAPPSRVAPAQVAAYGFEGYLSDFILGPAEVLNMLNEVARLNQIPVAAEALSEAQLARLLEGQPPFGKFLCGDNLFTITRSRYGLRQTLYTTEKLQGLRFFGSSALTEHAKRELEAEVAALRGRMQGIVAAVDTFEREMAELRAKVPAAAEALARYTLAVEEAVKRTHLRRTLESRLRAKEAQADKCRHESARNLDDKVAALEVKIRLRLRRVSEMALEGSALAARAAASVARCCHCEFGALEAENRVATLELLLGEIETRQAALKAEWARARAQYDEIKRSDAARQIQHQSQHYTSEERQTLGRLASEYLEAQTLTEHAIRSRIALLEEERALMSAVDHLAMELLRRKLQEIEFAERELPLLRRELARLDDRVGAMARAWEPRVGELANRISQAFRQRFTLVASDGQVELARSERYQDWRLHILVKFRANSELKVLDHQLQSGGERAVLTIFFIMLLQGLTDAPFRVVDEINQGMDPTNEKLAHRHLVQTACAGASQYFLVTPKLLTGLYYSRDMVVHCIFTERGGQKKPPGFMDFEGSEKCSAGVESAPGLVRAPQESS